MIHVSGWHGHRMLAPMTLALAGMFALPASADEGGVAFWFSGQYASFAAVPGSPGWSMPVQAYSYSGSASARKDFARGGSANAGLSSSAALVLVQPTYAPKAPLWGGQLSLGLGFGGGSSTTDADISVTGVENEFNRSDSISGFTDLYPIASVAWNKGNNNWMTYVTGGIPVGDYDSGRLSNIGLGHGAVDAGGGYTYFDEKKGHEFSAVMGVTYNLENPDTNYQNGIDIHLDWAASQMLNDHWQLGLVGYAYGQLSGDSSPNAATNGMKSSVLSIGPQIGYMFTVNGKPAYANLRAYWEFDASNRLEGTAVFATLSIPLGGKEKN